MLQRKIKDKEFCSLKTKMLRICIVLIFIMLLLCSVIFFIGNAAINKMQSNIDKQSLYDDYYETLDSLQLSLLNKLNGFQVEKREFFDEKLGKLNVQSKQMASIFNDPQFVDNSYLTEAYIKSVNDVLNSFDDISSKNLLDAYNKAEHIKTLITKNSSILSKTKKELISSNVDQFASSWNWQTKFIIIIVLLFSGLLLWGCMHMVNNIISPILRVTEQAEQISKGNYNIQQIQVSPRKMKDETQLLSNVISYMAITIKKQMHELEEKIQLSQKLHELELENMKIQITLTQTEMQLMQSMINPHFLFNCLNTLSSLAYIEQAPKVRKASQEIAIYLRDSLTRIGKSVSIESEILHTLRYIDIQKLRFGDRINIAVSCKQECYNEIIPAMLLQPLIENSITHGVSSYLHSGIITVDITSCGTIFLITVEDNGVGISEDRIKELQESLYSGFELGEHGIGLRSVAFRIKTYFNGNASVNIQSEVGSYTKVQLQWESGAQENMEAI